MTPDLDQHLAEAATAVAAAGDLDALRTVDSELLGKQSVVTEARKTLGGLDEDERKAVGQRLNEVRAEIEALVAARRSALEGEARAEQLEEERLDLTELDRGRRLGHRHVVTQTWERLEDLFVGMGYTVSEGPEIEDEWHNFGALNFPPDHPARDMYDTLYVDHGEPGSTLLRTHTSPVQIRVMEAGEPPIYSIMPGRVFRSDTADDPHAGVPPDRGPGGGPGHHLRGPGRDPGGLHPGLLRRGLHLAAPTVVLPVHRAVGRVRHPPPRRNVAGVGRLRNGSSQRLGGLRLGSRGMVGFRLRVWPRSPGTHAPRN